MWHNIIYVLKNLKWNFLLMICLDVSAGTCHEIELCNDVCQNGAECDALDDGKVKCTCVEGYTGALCQHDIIDCTENKCQFGTCEEQLNGFECMCYDGYESKE